MARTMRAPLDLAVKAGLRLMIHTDAGERWQDARLRVYCDEAPTGLLRCDIAIGQRRDLGGYSDEPQLVLTTRSASRAEAALKRHLPDEPVHEAPGGRLARVLSHADGSLTPILTLLSAIRPRTSRVALAPPRASQPPAEPPPLPYQVDAR